VRHQTEPCAQDELENQTGPDGHREQVLDQPEQREGEDGRQPHERDVDPGHRVNSALQVHRSEDRCPGGQ
jgi:hypothetical protein